MKIKPNVIICLCDQLRAFEIGCYGNKYIRTPCIDKMAEKGFKFDIGVTNALVCTPARASLISGQYSRTCVGSTNNSFADFTIRERRRIPEITIAEQLKANGYKTDLLLGQLMDIIMENSICEDTILVFTSDHGDNLGSHGFFNKEQLTEESIRIPLIINHPGRIRNIGDTSDIASIIDIMPTVLELTVLQTGTKEEVVASVRNGMPDGGYIFSTSNCIYTGMQLERYELMLDIWKKEGIY